MTNRQKIIITRGISGAGKSTWTKQFIAQNKHFIRVNKDEIRDELGIINWSKDREKEVVALQDQRVHDALQKGWSVVVDNTHLASKWIAHFRKIAEEYNADFEIKNFEIDVEEAIRRDVNREKSVGEKVIRRMYRQSKNFKVANPVTYEDGLDMCVIFDLDGTLCLPHMRSAYDGESCSTDLPNLPVIDVLKMYWDRGEDHVFIFSARNGESRWQTERWLEKHGVSYDMLVMRPIGDSRKDAIIKEEMYRTYIEGQYNVRAVFDDRNQTTAKYRELGLTCFQVADGNF